MKKITFIGMMALLVCCSTFEKKEFQRLNTLTTQKAVYKTIMLDNDSIIFDTINVWVKNGNFMMTNIKNLNENEEMKLIEFYEPYQTDEDGDSVLRRTFIYYDMKGDSIRYFDKTNWLLGETKFFEVNGEKHKVLKQPQWIFTKFEEPNQYEFYSDYYGLILVLTEKSRTELKSLFTEIEKSNLEELSAAIKADKQFFNMKRN